MAFVQNVWWLLVLIGVMILIHELGHFCAARWFDVRIEVFSFGFGPRLFGFRKGETDFRFSAILFGGYVKMAGEQPTDENLDDPRAFLAKPRWQRLIIALAGPTMNIVLAVAILTGLFMVRYQKPPESLQRADIGHVFADSAAAKAGIRDGDRIVRINDVDNPTWEQVAIIEIGSAGRPLEVKLQRGGETLWKTVTPVQDKRTGVGNAGWQEEGEIQIVNVQPGMPAEKVGLKRGDLLRAVNGFPIRSHYRLQEVIAKTEGRAVTLDYERDGRSATLAVTPVFVVNEPPGRWMIGVLLQPRLEVVQLSFPEAFRESLHQNLKGATLIYRLLAGIVERRMSPKTLEGPIGIARLSGEAAREGPTAFLSLMAMVSLNLAIFNLLPIPILDGGVVLVLFIEMLMRRDISMAVKETVFKLGFVFLMAVVVLVLYNDIAKMLPG